MAPHSSTLAWKIPWMEEPGGLQSMGSLKVGTWLSDFTFTFHFHALEKEMATHSSVLAWRIPGTGEPGELPSMGSHRVGHDWSDLAAAACQIEWQTLFSWTPKLLQMVTAAMKLKDAYSLGEKTMTNLDSILKSRDITLPTKVHLVKAMVFPVVMFGCESWTIKKVERQRTDELWCWIRL